MFLFRKQMMMLTASACIAAVASGLPAAAATPADTLVEALAIDDIITLDPGEAFELSTAEITGTCPKQFMAR